jgi:biopolymer transport protein ExbD
VAREHRRHARSLVSQARLALSITPMIDVVFLLLVYFLLTSGLGHGERLLRTEPAPAEAREAAGSLALEEEPLLVRVTRGAAGAPAIRISGGLAQPRDAADLARILRDALLTPDSPRGRFGPEHPVRIAPAADLPWQDVVAVFDAVRSAGYRMVAFGGGA